jgi:glycosyltransferase involved in cell wall biosynthesis
MDKSSVRIAVIIAPLCDDPFSPWYSHGGNSKLAQVVEILASLGLILLFVNTSSCSFPSNTGFDFLKGLYNNTFYLKPSESILNPFEGDETLKRLSKAFFLPRYPFKSILQNQQPSLIWVYNSRWMESLVAFRLKRQWPEAKLCVQLEDLPGARGVNSKYGKEFLDRVAAKKLLSKAELIVAVSAPVAEAVVKEYRTSKNRIVSFPPLLSPQFIEVIRNRRLPFTSHNVTVLYAGGLDVEKGILDLLICFNSLPANYYLKIIGGGPLVEDILHAASNNPRIQYLGPVVSNSPTLHRSYAEADVVVNPHRPIKRTDYIFPFKSVEQLASGALPLSTPIPGLDQIKYPSEFLFSNNEQLYQLLKQSHQIYQDHSAKIKSLNQWLFSEFSFDAMRQRLNSALAIFGDD